MKEVIINFESEKRDGIVAVGTYLIDAAKRLGIDIECDCIIEEIESTNSCAVKISKGKTLLSKPTKLEMEQLSSQARKSGERLACQTKIEKPGEITVMSVKKKETKEEKQSEEEQKREDFKKEFEDLPLEKKIANLVELEAIALSETVSYVLNSPYSAVGKVMDVLAEFGLNMEKEDKDAKRPDEHSSNGEKDSVDEKESTTDKKNTATKTRKTASKSSSTKKPAAKKPASSRKTTAKKTTRKRTTRKKTTKDNKEDTK